MRLPPISREKASSNSQDNTTAHLHGLSNQPIAPARYDKEVNSLSQNKPNRKQTGTSHNVQTLRIDHSRLDNRPNQKLLVSRGPAKPGRSPDDTSPSTNHNLDEPNSSGLRSPSHSDEDEPKASSNVPAGQQSLAGNPKENNEVRSESNEPSRGDESLDGEDNIHDLLVHVERPMPPERLIRQSPDSVDVNSKVLIEHLGELLQGRKQWREKEKELQRELSTVTDERNQLEEKIRKQEGSYKQKLEELGKGCESEIRDLTINRDHYRSQVENFQKSEKKYKSRITWLEADKREKEQAHLNEAKQQKNALRDLADRHDVEARSWRSCEETFKTEIDGLKRLCRDRERQCKSLSGEVELLKGDVDKIRIEKISQSQKLAAAGVALDQESKRSKAELSGLEIRYANLKEEKIQVQHNLTNIQTTLKASIKTLKLQKQNAESEVVSLTEENKALKEQQTNSKTQISHLEATVSNLTTRQLVASEEIESLNEALRKSQEDHFFHRDDAQQLRAYISEAGKQQSPIRGETIYIRCFRELKTDIESWIARNAKASVTRIFSIHEEAHILGKLTEFGIHGQKAAAYLRIDNRIQRWCRNPSYRIQLVRHIVAAFLFGYIFQPFIVGLPATSREPLSWIIDNDIRFRGALPKSSC